MNFDLKVGFHCNNDCIHCVITDKKFAGNLKTDEIKQIILNDSGRDKIVITGGEASIRSDFLEIIRFAKEEANVKSLILQTNGRMFSNKQFTKTASEYLDQVLVAIHSHNEIVHDTITQRKNSWKETMDGVKNMLSANKIKVQSQTVLSKLNCDNVKKTIDFINSIGIKNNNLTYAHACGNAKTNIKISQPKYSTIKDQVEEIIKRYRDNLYIEMIPRCITYPYILKDDHYNDYNIISKKEKKTGIDISNISGKSGGFNERGITEDYTISIMSEMRKPDSCNECIFNNKCLGVWKEYYDLYKSSIDLRPIIGE